MTGNYSESRWPNTDPATASKRAGGRRKRLARMRLKMARRRERLLAIAMRESRNIWEPGFQPWAAKKIGVSQPTVSRDLQAIRAEMEKAGRCPCCNRPIATIEKGAPRA